MSSHQYHIIIATVTYADKLAQTFMELEQLASTFGGKPNVKLWLLFSVWRCLS